MYRQMLTHIDSELRQQDLKDLKFLCSSAVQKKYLSDFRSGLELFDALEKCNRLSEENMLYLAELLSIIGRIDLATDIDPSSDFVETDQSGGIRVCPFYVLLYRLSEELGFDDLHQLRYLYGRVPKSTEIEDGTDLFSIMLQHRAISTTNLTTLTSYLQTIQRNDLVEKINSFAARFTPNGKYIWDSNASLVSQGIQEESQWTEVIPVMESGHTDFPMEESMETHCDPNVTNYKNSTEYFSVSGVLEGASPLDSGEKSCSANTSPSTPPFDDPLFSMASETSEQAVGATEPAHKVHDPIDSVNVNLSVQTTKSVLRPNLSDMPSKATQQPQDQMGADFCYYKMDSRPRGICLIIDNEYFDMDPRDPEAVELGRREGSSIDREKLRHTFENLDFLVVEKPNLTHIGINETMKEISMLPDHENYDCFVCCILSHGGDGYIFGTNGRKVTLAEITFQFRANSCAGLAGKPKLFFVAACRGKQHQDGYNPNRDIHHDAPSPVETTSWIANDEDFLFSFATVSNHVSYRSRSRGTFYVSLLTEILDQYAKREELQHLLLRVNRELCQKYHTISDNGEAKVVKQVANPNHTLRKLLKFC